MSWAYCNCSGADAFLKRAGMSLGTDYWAQIDIWIPSKTLVACIDRGDTPHPNLYGESADLFALTRPSGGGYNENDTMFAYNNGSPVSPNWQWWESWTSSGPSGSVTTNTPHTLKVHVNTSTNLIQWYVDGTLLFSFTRTGYNLVNGFAIGGAFSERCHCEWYYLSNFKVGTTDGGSDIASDDFSSGLGAWTVVGNVTVVGSPVDTCVEALVPDCDISPTGGPYGTVVTVTGTNFDPSSAITVQMGGTPVTFSTATTAPDGSFTGTFTVPCNIGSTGGYAINVSTAGGANHNCTHLFSVSPPTLTVTPESGGQAFGIIGTTLTITGSGYCCFSPVSFTWGSGGPVIASGTTDGSGNFTSTFAIPAYAVPGDFANVVGHDGCNNGASFTVFVCAVPGGTYDDLYYNAVQGPGGVSYGINYIFQHVTNAIPSTSPDYPGPYDQLLDWCETSDAWYVLFNQRQVGIGTGTRTWASTTFPPPSPSDGTADTTMYPLYMFKFPKDGSAYSRYNISGFNWCWVFNSTFYETPGCFGPQVPGVDCTPGPTGRVYRESLWMTGYQKYLIKARIASDGTNVWVAAVAVETAVYPYITSDDDHFYDDSSATGFPTTLAQFTDLATLTSGWTVFQTAETHCTEEYATLPVPTFQSSKWCRWEKWGGGSFVPDSGRAPESDGGDNYTGYYQLPRLVVFHFNGTGFDRLGSVDAKYAWAISSSAGNPINFAPNTLIGELAAAASPAQPGVCHVVWGEGGAYGQRYRPGTNANSPSGNWAVWDKQQPTIAYRSNYTRWSTSTKTLDTDLWTGTQNRTNWFNTYSGTKYDNGPAPNSAYGATVELRNQHGSPGLFIGFYNWILLTITYGGQNQYSYRSIESLKYYDLSSGAAILKQTLAAATFAPTLAETQLVDPTATNVSDSILVPNIDYAFTISDIYSDPTLSGANQYVVMVDWTADIAASSLSVQGFGVYRIKADGSTAFDFFRGNRTLAIGPTATHPSIGPGLAAPFVIGTQDIWMIGSAANQTWRLDFGPCGRWWQDLNNPVDFFNNSVGLQWPLYPHGTAKLMSPGWQIFGGVLDPDDVVWPAFGQFTTIGPGTYFGIGTAPIRTTLNCICLSPLCNGPIWFYVGGQWRQAGVDPDWNVYVFRNGTWHPVCTDPDTDAYVQLQGAWVPG